MTHIRFKATNRLKVKGWKKIYHTHRVSTSVHPTKIDFKTNKKNVTGDAEEYFINIKC